LPGNHLRIIFLGGLGEIGRNMLALEYDHDLLIVDAGTMIPNNDMLGVDVIIPQMEYLFERADQVRAIVVTHGHEDHIGALPYLLEKVKAPIYATRLTRGLIEVKLREAKTTDVDFHTITPDDVPCIDPFHIEFFRVSHSIPDGVGLAITTPVGLVVHSGDFKFDHSPVDGRPTDFAKLTELGGRGVLLLLSDSTNAESAGYTPSERELGKALSRAFDDAQGRVIVATFASNISRLQQVMSTAASHGRRVAIVGRSMVNNVKIARDLGYLDVEEDLLLPIDDLKQLPDKQTTLICTGSQGEPTSALVRMAQGTLRQVSIVEGDTVIVSASPIPGNEEFVNRTLDNLFRLGARVYYDDVLDVHVSGHASQEEQKLMINLIRPEHFVPIHGEYRHLVWHAELAKQCGIPSDRIHVVESGDVLETDGHSTRVVDCMAEDYVYVDGHGIGDVKETLLDDRRLLAQNGFLVVVAILDKYTNSLVGRAQIVTRGFIGQDDISEFKENAQSEIVRAIELGGTRSQIADRLQHYLFRFAHEATGRRPVVVPVIAKI